MSQIIRGCDMDLLPVGTPIRFLDLIIGHRDGYGADFRLTVFAGKGEQGRIAGYTRSHRCVYMVKNDYGDVFSANSTDFEVMV